MKTDKMIDAMQHIDDDILSQVDAVRNHKSNRKLKRSTVIKWASTAAGLALVLIVAGKVFLPGVSEISKSNSAMMDENMADSVESAEMQPTGEHKVAMVVESYKDGNCYGYAKENSADGMIKAGDKICVVSAAAENAVEETEDTESTPTEAEESKTEDAQASAAGQGESVEDTKKDSAEDEVDVEYTDCEYSQVDGYYIVHTE